MKVLPVLHRLHRARRTLTELKQRSAPEAAIKLAVVNVKHLRRLVRKAKANVA